MSGYQQYVGRSNDLAANVNSGPIAGLRNAIIGGDFGVNPWQRGTTFMSAANGSYSADRWRYSSSGTGVVDISNSSSAPTVAQAGRLVTNSLLIDCTTADATIAAGEFYFIDQRIEGYVWQTLAQRTMVLSFWHAHTKTGTYCVALRNGGADRAFIVEYTQAVSDAWEYAEFVIPASPSAGTWNYTTGIGLSVNFIVAAGSTFHTTANAWNTGNFLATANQVNGLDSTANNFRLALVQLEAGLLATPFEGVPRGLVDLLCQRYFSKSFSIGTAPSNNVGVASGEESWNATLIGAVSSVSHSIVFPVRMRATPSITIYNPSAGNSEVRNNSDGADASGTSPAAVNDRRFLIAYTGNVGQSTGDQMLAHWTADAEL